MAMARPATASDLGGLAAPTRVKIVDYAFKPRGVTIAVGGGVIWRNMGPSPHTTTSDTSQWDSGVLNVGDTFSYIFNTAGVFNYHCNIHPFMTARITVTGT
jgi:plastocyanin